MELREEQILQQLKKIMKKFYKYLDGLESKKIASTFPRLKDVSLFNNCLTFVTMIHSKFGN